MAHLDLVALIVDDYDPAIDFFVRVLGFELIEDAPSTTNDGRPKRWVVVRPAGGTTGILLARADGEHQKSAVGHQFAGRVGLFLRVDDFDTTYARMIAAGVTFITAPRPEPYGKVAVFVDIAGNRWDLLGPRLDSAKQDRRIEIGATVLMGADIPNAEPMRSAYLTLTLDREEDAERIYALLSDGGEIFMKMEKTPFANRFAMLRDRFGASWMLLHQPASA